MIQELFGGGNSASTISSLSERKLSHIPYSPSPTCHATTSPLLTTSSNTLVSNSPNVANNSNNNSNNNNNNTENNNNNGQNLRCPRCDSTNTKFCYYNNYNLTQPRHFCKTCRRYWTKGGTLRNVPIGGGCRKNKTIISTNNNSSSNLMSKSCSNIMAHKVKATLSSELLANESSLFLGSGLLDPQLQPNGSSPLLWSSPQNSHILALLRGSTPTSPFSNPNPSQASTVFTNLGLDSYGNGAPSLLGSFTRNNNNNQHHHNLNGFHPEFNADHTNNSTTSSNILDLYQRLKSSSTNYGYCGNENQGAVILGNMVGSTPTSSTSSMNTTVLDATPLGGSSGGGGSNGGSFEGYGFMSPSPAIPSWSEFPAVSINGSFS